MGATYLDLKLRLRFLRSQDFKFGYFPSDRSYLVFFGGQRGGKVGVLVPGIKYIIPGIYIWD